MEEDYTPSEIFFKAIYKTFKILQKKEMLDLGKNSLI